MRVLPNLVALYNLQLVRDAAPGQHDQDVLFVSQSCIGCESE